MLHTGFDAPTGQPGAGLHPRGPCRISGDPRAAQSAAAGDRRADGRLDGGRSWPSFPAIVAQAHANGVTDVRPSTPTSPPPGAASRAGRARRRGHSAASTSSIPGPRRWLMCCKAWRWRRGPARQPRSRRRLRRRGAGGWPRTTGPVEARIVINAAGLQGDLIEAIARPIALRDQAAQGSVRRLRQARGAPRSPPASCRCRASAPRASWSARTIFGNLLVGPDGGGPGRPRRMPRSIDAALEALIDKGRRILPGLAARRSRPSMPACARPPSSRTTRSRPCRDRNWITVGRHPLHRPHRRAGHRRFTRRRSIAGISASFASSLPASILAAQSRRASAAPPCCARLWRDGLPLRARDAGRDRGCPGRAAARRAISAG